MFAFHRFGFKLAESPQRDQHFVSLAHVLDYFATAGGWNFHSTHVCDNR
ncbi:MAG: hypothetical protein JWM99_1003 [Verrucomicrobiales bacterium]|nr:hypothetical protein [Verrucomicrobiales bacterium]